MKKPVRVVIVDDSALVRKVLSSILEADPGIQIVGIAKDPYEARDIIVRENPDVMTLDIEMPKMDGITFLKKMMRVMPIPTLIVSSLAESGKAITIQALEAGAVDIIKKPTAGLEAFFKAEANNLCERVKAVAGAHIQHKKSHSSVISTESIERAKLDETTDKVIAIGASTGGVEALARILPAFPASSPGIVITQHMPEGFTKSFADRLNSLCSINVKEAKNDDRIQPGHALVAPGGEYHLEVIRVGGQYRVKLLKGEKVSFNRPSVDVMFSSVAKNVGRNCVAILMTGMGKDGAVGLREIREAGGKTFIQDEKSCVVFGMPGEAWAIGAAEIQVSLDAIPFTILNAVNAK